MPEQGSEHLERLRELTAVLARLPRRGPVQSARASNIEMDERLLGILECGPDGVLLVDAAGTIVLANARVVELFGYSRPELLGQSVETLLPEARRAIHAKHRAAYFAAPKKRSMGADLDIVGRRKDGTEVKLEIALGYLELEDGLFAMAWIRERRGGG